MLALRFVNPGRCEVDEIPIPSIADDEVLVATRAVGICHSDLELLAGRYIIPIEFPIIPGHEWSGVIVATGRNVRSLREGDRVVGECVIGRDHFGFSISGAAAEFFVAKEAWLHKLPESLDWTQGALVEPFSCGYYATLRADHPDASDTVVVFGAGPIGLGVVAACRARGCRVLVVEPDPKRGELATRLGAETVLDPEARELTEAVLDLTHGAGATVVFEASGKAGALTQAFEVAAYGGRVVCIGINIGERIPARLGLIQAKELQIRGIVGSPGVWERTLRFLEQSGLDLRPIVTSQFPLADATRAIDAVQNDRSQVKVHIVSSASL
ncbi:MAG: zinc-binding dehydrogenase [Acidothermus sp.]|nr:zinc-binding dehydrogenase [Acidothermus sp.]